MSSRRRSPPPCWPSRQTHVGRFRFAHALINQTLYEGLGATRRARMHQRVAEALEELYGADPGEHLGELALHWRLATVSVDKAKAADYALQSGAARAREPGPCARPRSVRRRGRATRARRRRERCEALIGLGEAQRQTGDAAFRDTSAGGLAASPRSCGTPSSRPRPHWRTAGVRERDRRASTRAACGDRARARARRSTGSRPPRAPARAAGDGAQLGPGPRATQSARRRGARARAWRGRRAPVGRGAAERVEGALVRADAEATSACRRGARQARRGAR